MINLISECNEDIKLKSNDNEKQEESQEVKWTIVVQCVKEGNNPPNYKIVMNYYGDAPVPILKCESDQTEWIKEE